MKFLHAHRSFLFKTEKVYIIEKQDGEREIERERERELHIDKNCLLQ